MPLTNPVIVLPGVTANYLRDDYPFPPDTIWSVLNKDYNRAALHPDDLRYEAVQPARVAPGQLYELVYKELVEELRYNLKQREDEPVPVYMFAYDWRQPLETTELQLGEFVREVIARTKLLRHYDRDGYGYGDRARVDLVGHSMGGLIIAGYIERNAGNALVGKVATLGTPYQGSFEAVIKVTTGTANLGTEPPSSREREASRMTPALYHLLPNPTVGLKVDDPKLPKTLYDPTLWQPSVVATIEEYIRLRGLGRGNRRQQARELFATMLDQAQQHRNRTDTLTLSNARLRPEDWLCIVGVDALTRVQLSVVRSGSAPEFQFDSSDRMNHWGEGDPQLCRLTGDGTVPFEGALPKFLSYENVVCVRPKDFGYWEIVDRGLAETAGFHGMLPAMDMLHRMIVRHFRDLPDKRGNTWGRPAPGVAVEDWRPPLPLDAKN